MILFKSAREFYALQITTTPAVTGGWSASFDSGTTWVAGAAATVNGVAVTRWLIAGPTAAVDGTTPAATLAGNVTPLIRATEAPEVVVRSAPQIALV